MHTRQNKHQDRWPGFAYMVAVHARMPLVGSSSGSPSTAFNAELLPAPDGPYTCAHSPRTHVNSAACRAQSEVTPT